MEIITQYPAECLYVWLILQIVWISKLPLRPLPLLGFAFSHGLLLVAFWFFRADMPYLLNLRYNHKLSSFVLILCVWIGVGLFYIGKIAALKNPKRRPKRQ